jgi:hypothetical protein
MSKRSYYYHINWAGAIFVKEGEFFAQQGGLVQPWGKNWKKIEAESLDDAREKVNKIAPEKRI